MDKRGWQVRWVDAERIDRTGDADERGDITLERARDGYRLLSGGQALADALAMGRTQVEAVVRPPKELAARVGELLTRMTEGRLHFLSEAESYQALLADGEITAKDLGERLGRSPSSIQKKLRLLELSQAARQAVLDGGLSEHHALLLLRIPGDEGRIRMAKHIAKEGLTAAQAEQLISETLRRMPLPVPTQRKLMPLMRDYRLYLNAFKGIVEQMQGAGLDANMTLQKGVSIVELRVTVPVFQGRAAK